MSYGLTPYDKKTYKESKKRIRQSQIADNTGKIIPYRNRSQKLLIAMIILGAAVLTVVAVMFFSSNSSFDSSGISSSSGVQTGNERDLLVVVNQTNPIDKDYCAELKNYDGFKVDAEIYSDLDKLYSKAKADGIVLRLAKAYVSYEEQQRLYEQKFNELLLNSAYTRVRAEAEAQKTVPKAGCSEFQTGLLIEFDITDSSVKTFLERNCINFGFVQRYTSDKEDITGIKSSDGIYRYVGIKNAVNMRSFGMCLEEYSEYISVQKGE